MLNIGKLTPGAAEYYVGEVATSAEDYYTGRGEAQGRWVGSLREVLRLDGEVDPEHFRRVLVGQQPHTGDYLISAAGSSGRAARRRTESLSAEPADAALVDTARAAAALGVSTRYVRMLLDAGDRYRTALDEAGPDDTIDEPRSYLVGERTHDSASTRADAWRIPRAELGRFADNRDPRKPRPGFDLTLRPPKSVSVLWALADDPTRATIRNAHARAVDEIVGYIEARALRGRATIRRRQHLLETDGLIAAAFDHRTSRAGDPLLHTHVVVANMTRVDAGDGPVWRAIAAHGLFEHAKAAGYLYQAHLRHELSHDLGVRWGPVVHGYADIEGVPAEVNESFSKRSTEIAEVLAESSNSSARAAQIATLESRKPKNYQVDPDTLFEQWRTEAMSLGFGAKQVAACLNRGKPSPLTVSEIEAMLLELAGPDGLTERASTFRRTDVIEALASRSAAACTAAEIESLADAFLASDACVVVDDAAPGTAPASTAAAPPTAPTGTTTAPTKRRAGGSTQMTYTTLQLAAIEEQLLSWANDTAIDSTLALPGAVVGAVLRARPELSVEQAAMVRIACFDKEPILPVAGRPGAGKTYATEATVAAHVAAGVPIVGAAVSATAAAELEAAAGFARSTMPATTVAKLVMDLDRWGGLAPGSVVVVDEASMLSTRDLHRLVAHARHAAGSLILVGDSDQHGPVDVGGVFQRLCRDRGDGLLRLVENNRQTDHVDRLAIGEYRDGHISDALARLDNAGRIVRSQTAGESFDAMVADWYADHLAGRADPMIAGPNSTRRALNERARALLKTNGELTGEPLVVANREFLIGDRVVARRNDRRLRSNGGSQFVKNGSAGVVTHLHHRTGEVTVDFEREGTIRVPRRYLAAGRLEHGYARTSYGVQGTTHTVGRYHPTDLSGFEEGYVAITRGQQTNRLYIVDGTMIQADEEAHQAPEVQRFDLDDIAGALGRRRTGTMAADNAERLTTVHDLATRHSLAELGQIRQQLEQVLAQAPADVSPAIQDATSDLEALHTRRNLWTATDGPTRRIQFLDGAIGKTSQRLDEARSRQEQRTEWLDKHADVVDRHDLMRRAERHRRSKIAANPEQYLPPDVAEQTGPAPLLQRERRAWSAALVDKALAHDTAAPSQESMVERTQTPDIG